MLHSAVGIAAATGVAAGISLGANAKTTITTITMVRPGTIKEIRVGYGGVVDAKAATGFLEVESNTQKFPFRVPLGLGAGGAAAAFSGGKAFSIPCSLPVSVNEILTISAHMNEACVAAHASIKYTESKGGRPTLADCNTVELAAVTAATLMTVGSVTIPQGKSGTIKKLFIAACNLVDAKTASGYVDIIGDDLGEQRYVFGGANGGQTDGGFSCAPEVIDVDMPAVNNKVIIFKMYSTDAMVDAHVGILWQ